MKVRAGTLIASLGAWSIAFGCAVGWDAFVLPWTTFLPKAGPLGTVVGILLGAVVMTIVAWNYHVMINRHPGPGGVYVYASSAFGADHGFLCAWFLCFTYMAIVWLDATVLGVIVNWAFGSVLAFGFRYTVSGFAVYPGYILLPCVALAIAAAICCRRHLSRFVLLVLSIAFVAGILVCFVAALWRGGGLGALSPAFSPAEPGTDAAAPPLAQILHILAFAPWLFVGFEAISNVSGDDVFPANHSFRIMVAALGTSVAAYLLLAALPVLSAGADGVNWVSAIARMTRPFEGHAFSVAALPLGAAGRNILFATLLTAVFTNLIGNTVAASRLIAAMADDGALPAWLSRRARDGAPRNAVLAILALSPFVFVLGRVAIGVLVDLALFGSVVAYAYTSAATVKSARNSGSRLSVATGLCGLVLSVALLLLYVLPSLTTHTSEMSTVSYLVVILWCILGLVHFLAVFLRRRDRRFGHSTVVWISLLGVILLMAILWIRESTYETTSLAFDKIVAHHAPLHDESHEVAVHDDGDIPDWHDTLRSELDAINRSILRDNLVQLSLTVLAFGLMLALYAALRRREREHEHEKARAKSYFISTVSHDIRTPLNAIIGFSELLRAGFKTEAERDQAIHTIITSGQTLLELVDDILDLSKLEAGKMEISPKPTDCPRLVCDILDAFRVAAAKPGLELRLKAGEMPQLMIDPQRLRQIVYNIVGNAVKYTEKGHVEVRVSFERDAGGDTGTFRFAVEDTGCGISEENLARIASAWVQVGSKISRNGGTGLGLAICKQLAAAMGGSLGMESELGKGSTFTITIPGVAVAQETAPLRKEGCPVSSDAPLREGGAPQGRGENAGRGGTPHSPPGASLLPPPGEGQKESGDALPTFRILVVDDSSPNRMVLKAHLKKFGVADVETANDGEEALQRLRAPGAAPFDLVLTDMWMPNLDGEGLVKTIRADPVLSSLKVIVVTADVELQGKSEAMGFDGIIFKPMTMALVGSVLSDLEKGNPHP